MKNTERSQYIARDSIMKLLSEAETASVNGAEAAASLTVGDEYVDLQHIDRGVLKASGGTAPTGRVLPRRGVSTATWSQILRRLPASRVGSVRTPTGAPKRPAAPAAKKRPTTKT